MSGSNVPAVPAHILILSDDGRIAVRISGPAIGAGVTEISTRSCPDLGSDIALGKADGCRTGARP
jgi:hypothetical protein